MKITKAAFLEAIEFPCTIAKTGRALPITSMLLLSASNNKFTATACDLDQHCVGDAACDGNMESVCVSAAHLKSLSPLFEDEIDLMVKNKFLHIASCGNFKLATLPAEEFPAWKLVNPKKIGCECALIADGVKRVSFAQSTNIGRANLMAVHVVTSEKMILCEATNGRDMARVEKQVIAGKGELVIPSVVVSNACRALAEDGAVLSIGENAAAVEYATGKYSFKLLDMSYPNTQAIASGSRKPFGEIHTKRWASAIRSALALHNEKSNKIMPLKVSGGTIECVPGENAFSVKHGDSLQEHDLNLSPSALLSCLDAFGDAVAKVSIQEQQNALVMECGDLTVFNTQLR